MSINTSLFSSRKAARGAADKIAQISWRRSALGVGEGVESEEHLNLTYLPEEEVQERARQLPRVPRTQQQSFSSSSSSSSSSTSRKRREPVQEKNEEKEQVEEKDRQNKKRRSQKKMSQIMDGVEVDRFVTLKRNTYVKRKPSRCTDLPQCTCDFLPGSNVSPCSDESCLNRAVYVECTPESCGFREKCRNQRLQRNEYKRTRVFECGEKGFGLRADEPIGEGEFVVEYVGEVISQDECFSRMANEARHFYFMCLPGSEYIDASRKGNKARFINHSCAPNCVTTLWTVRGEPRVGIFALRDIRQGEELTFDYQFESIGIAKQRCLCGEDTCRGVIGAKPPSESSAARRRNRSSAAIGIDLNSDAGTGYLATLLPPVATPGAQQVVDTLELADIGMSGVPRSSTFLRRNIRASIGIWPFEHMVMIGQLSVGESADSRARALRSRGGSARKQSSSEPQETIAQQRRDTMVRLDKEFFRHGIQQQQQQRQRKQRRNNSNKRRSTTQGDTANQILSLLWARLSLPAPTDNALLQES